jgi:hypothetical protein
MHTLNDEIGYTKEWSPLSIDLKLVSDTLKEVALRNDVADPDIADSFSKKVLAVADHLLSDLTRLKLYYVSTRSNAKDRLNDVKCSVIDEKSEAGKERVALCDTEFKRLRDEYKKAEQLMIYLEIKYKELISYHYSFKDTARRLSGQRGATTGQSDSEREDPTFGVGQIPLDTTGKTSEAQKDQEPF